MLVSLLAWAHASASHLSPHHGVLLLLRVHHHLLSRLRLLHVHRFLNSGRLMLTSLQQFLLLLLNLPVVCGLGEVSGRAVEYGLCGKLAFSGAERKKSTSMARMWSTIFWLLVLDSPLAKAMYVTLRE